MIIGILFTLIISIALIPLFSGFPLIGICVLCLLSTLETLDLHIMGKTWKLMDTGLVLFLAAQNIRFLITMQYDKRWLTPYAIMGTAILFSSLCCLNPTQSIIQSLNWFFYVAAGYFVGVGLFHNKKSLPILIHTFIISLCLSIVFSVYSYISTRGGGTFQLQGGFVNKHYYTIFILCLLPFLLNFALQAKNPRRQMIHTIIFFFFIILVIMTGSFVGILLTLALLGFSFGYGLLQKRQITWFIPIAVLLLLHWIQSGIQFPQFLTNWIGTDYQDWIEQGLLSLYLMARNPFFGVGYGQMEAYIQWAYPDIVLAPSTFNASIFSLLGETGLFGGLAFIVIFFVLLEVLLSYPANQEEEYRLNRAAQVSCILLGTAAFLYEVHLHLFTWCWLGILYGLFSCERKGNPVSFNPENTQPVSIST